MSLNELVCRTVAAICTCNILIFIGSTPWASGHRIFPGEHLLKIYKHNYCMNMVTLVNGYSYSTSSVETVKLNLLVA